MLLVWVTWTVERVPSARSCVMRAAGLFLAQPTKVTRVLVSSLKSIVTFFCKLLGGKWLGWEVEGGSEWCRWGRRGVVMGGLR